jgi:hypothetical protein|tara:strand:- start:25 stop:228 length:204 start_codon:yes stop_codon:yes gene_type:complete
LTPADYIKKINNAETHQEVLDLWGRALDRFGEDRAFLAIHRECWHQFVAALKAVPTTKTREMQNEGW